MAVHGSVRRSHGRSGSSVSDTAISQRAPGETILRFRNFPPHAVLCSGLPPAFCRTPAPPNPANMATTTEAARPKREAKAVEHFTIESKEVDPDDLKIKAGGGAKFGDVENIVFKIAKLNAQACSTPSWASAPNPNPNPSPNPNPNPNQSAGAPPDA